MTAWHPEAAAPRARIAQTLERAEGSLAELERHYGPGYAAGLYPTA